MAVVKKLFLAVAIFLTVISVSTAAESIGQLIRKRFQKPNDLTSCVGRCHDGIIPEAPCQCNLSCKDFNDCCDDYDEVCAAEPGSCKGKCDQSGTIPGAPCQCNRPCMDFGDCCPDYEEECGVSDGVSDEDLALISEEIFALEATNNVAHLVAVSLQSQTTPGGPDNCPFPLLNVNEAAYERTTINLMVQLFDNYVPDVTVTEDVTPEEIAEEEAFLDAIFATPIMTRTQEFLASKNLPNGRAKFREIWFDLYNRGGGHLGSSGFEHVFCGETNGNSVSGFHNYLYFAREEEAGRLDYNGFMATMSLAAKGSIIEHTFDWLGGRNKPITSMMIGTSPEFEMALYTICFHARTDAMCRLSLNGTPVHIQTYDIFNNGKQLVATAYPDLSP